MTATAPAHGDTTRKDLVAFLMKHLQGRSDIAKMHRKVKTFVYSLQVDALKELSGATCMWTREPGECITVSPDVLEDLMQRALACGGVGVYQEDGSESAMQVNDGVSSQVASIGLTKGLNEIYGEKAKKRLKKARQMIDKHLFTMTFVVMDDVIDMVKAVGVADLEEATRRAHRIWTDRCFSLEICRTTQGVEGTRAEFMCDWLRSGYSWEASITHLDSLSRTNSTRPLSPTFKADAMKWLREKSATTYTGTH